MPEKSSEKKLMPNALLVKTADGTELVVPSNKEENSIANKIVAAQIRQVLVSSIKKFKDLDAPLSPKELKDLADAGKALAQFSGDVYNASDEVKEPRVVSSENESSAGAFEEIEKK